MDQSDFEQLVIEAIQKIPHKLRTHLNNVDVVVKDRPETNQLAGHIIGNDDYLLGLYEGIPLTERTDYGMILPDKITLFQEPIENVCANKEEIIEEIYKTVLHEVAHHFGIEDDHLEYLQIWSGESVGDPIKEESANPTTAYK